MSSPLVNRRGEHSIRSPPPARVPPPPLKKGGEAPPPPPPAKRGGGFSCLGRLPSPGNVQDKATGEEDGEESGASVRDEWEREPRQGDDTKHSRDVDKGL